MACSSAARGHAVLLHQAAEFALVSERGKQEELAGDVGIAALLRFLVGEVEEIVEVARDGDVAAVALDPGQARDGFLDAVLQRRHARAGLGQQAGGAAAFLVQERGHEVQGLDELLVGADGIALRVRDGLLELGGEFVETHECPAFN